MCLEIRVLLSHRGVFDFKPIFSWSLYFIKSISVHYIKALSTVGKKKKKKPHRTEESKPLMGIRVYTFMNQRNRCYHNSCHTVLLFLCSSAAAAAAPQLPAFPHCQIRLLKMWHLIYFPLFELCSVFGFRELKKIAACSPTTGPIRIQNTACPLQQPLSCEAMRAEGNAVINTCLIFNHDNTAANHIRANAC